MNDTHGLHALWVPRVEIPPKFIQLMPTVFEDGQARPARLDEHAAAQHSVYQGEPGSFEWAADFASAADAEEFAYKQCRATGASLIRGAA